jgi:CHAT domain-containing protein
LTSLTNTQTFQNGTSSDPNKTTPEATTAAILTVGASQGTPGSPSPGSALQISNIVQQGTESQSKGDYQGAVLDFRQAADMLLQQTSLPQAREAIELMKTAELQDYFQDAGISVDQQHKTRLEDLPEDTAVIYTLVFPKRLDLVLVLKSGIKKFTVPVDSESLTQEVNKLRISLQRRTTWDYMEEAHRFYNLIIKPLELDLSIHGINTLVFMPDGGLRTVPFAALHDGRQFLIERFAIVVTPSLGLTDIRFITRKEPKVLSAGLTESVQGFAPLPNVKDELDGIQGLYKSDRLENGTFMSASVRDGLRDNPYSVVHIATHGSFASKASDTFLLAWDGKIGMNQLDGMIKQPRVNNAPLELLSLSACDTAAGDDKAALGLAGVAVKAGSRSALATLWSVSDQAASELVLEFYRQLQNPSVSKAEALQAAQLKLMDSPNYRHPFYWSPFLLIGNWL